MRAKLQKSLAFHLLCFIALLLCAGMCVYANVNRAFAADLAGGTMLEESTIAVAYYIFLGVVFRRLSERRSTARRCALARNIGADGPHDRVRTCDAAILAHI